MNMGHFRPMLHIRRAVTQQLSHAISPAPPCPDYIVCYMFFLFIKSRQLVDKTLNNNKIQIIQNEIKFLERLSTKQNLKVPCVRIL